MVRLNIFFIRLSFFKSFAICQRSTANRWTFVGGGWESSLASAKVEEASRLFLRGASTQSKARFGTDGVGKEAGRLFYFVDEPVPKEDFSDTLGTAKKFPPRIIRRTICRRQEANKERSTKHEERPRAARSAHGGNDQ